MKSSVAPPLSSGFILFVTATVLTAAAPTLKRYTQIDGNYTYNKNMIYLFVELLKWLVALCCCYRQNAFNCKLCSTSKQRALFFTAFLAFVQNNLGFIVLLYFSAASFQLLMNLRIVALAVISRLVLGFKLDVMQHLIMFLQCVGAMQHFLSLSDKAFPIPLMPCLSMLCVVTSSALANLHNLECGMSKPNTHIMLQNVYVYAYGITFNALNWARSILMGDTPIGDISWPVVVLVVVTSLYGLCISMVHKELGTLVGNAIGTFAIVVAAVCEYGLFQNQISLLAFTTFIVMIVSSCAYTYASGHADTRRLSSH